MDRVANDLVVLQDYAPYKDLMRETRYFLVAMVVSKWDEKEIGGENHVVSRLFKKENL